MEINIALVIVFNHRYEQNIEKLEGIYAGRFQHIYYLVPFYDGDHPRVIPVYENSYYYQGYIAQGFRSYFEEKYSHYFFVADDLVLNPVINERNLMEHFSLKDDACFIEELLGLHLLNNTFNTRYAYAFNISRAWGLEAVNQIPSYAEALQHFKRFELEIKPLGYNQAFGRQGYFKKFKRLAKQLAGGEKTLKRDYHLSYPLVNAFSDLIILSRKSIKQFAHYCGVFAAAELFVELAIPTSLIFSAESISTAKDLKLHGKYLKTETELKELDRFNLSLADLTRNFPEGYLYLHPVKLSKWKS
jgi:hypothetical protein